MIVILLALGSAAVYGAGDFFGGSASRRSSTLGVLLVSLPTGLLLLLPFAFAFGGTLSWSSLSWGFAAGLAGGIGLVVFYNALAAGPMTVVAPISGLIAAVVPVMAGVLRGERLSLVAITGMVLCLVAITFVSMQAPSVAAPTTAARHPLLSGPVQATLAGLGFGIFFVLLRQAGDHGALWTVAASKAAGLAVTVVLALISGRSLRFPRTLPFPKDGVAIRIAVLAGVLDVGANCLYLVAAQEGKLSIAGLLSSLYPASTVLLARFVHHERLRLVQRFGLVLAVAGVALVTVT
jgi:drug/metabolite transporter (DMT)-like permease